MEPTPAPGTPPNERLLRRSLDGAMIGGVASGLARYFDVDVVVARIALVTLAFLGIGVPIYLAAWLLVPDESSESSVADHLFGQHRAEVVQRDRPGAHGPSFQGSGHGF